MKIEKKNSRNEMNFENFQDSFEQINNSIVKIQKLKSDTLFYRF